MKDDLSRFRVLVNQDAALQQRLRKGADPIAMAGELGYKISRDELAAVVKDAELSDFELELVSGGSAAATSASKGASSVPGPLNTQINKQVGY